MSDTTTSRPTPRKRGEGQWGLGYHEPLNTAEQIKKDDDGLNVRERIDRIFAPGPWLWPRAVAVVVMTLVLVGLIVLTRRARERPAP